METLLAQLVGLAAAGVILFAGSWLCARISPPSYELPVWVCRLRLEYWAWRAGRRQRRDERMAAQRRDRLTSVARRSPRKAGLK
jgi:hypothetical protein